MRVVYDVKNLKSKRPDGEPASFQKEKRDATYAIVTLVKIVCDHRLVLREDLL
jgi:hypothetical protein